LIIGGPVDGGIPFGGGGGGATVMSFETFITLTSRTSGCQRSAVGKTTNVMTEGSLKKMVVSYRVSCEMDGLMLDPLV
jgi:hypothetical protein